MLTDAKDLNRCTYLTVWQWQENCSKCIFVKTKEPLSKSDQSSATPSRTEIVVR